MPKLKLGSANVGPAADPGKGPFRRRAAVVPDETLGGNDQEVQLRSLNIRLMLSTQDLAGYEVLPIAQVQRAGEREATPLVDADYFPPMLACDAWPPLALGIIRAIYDIIGKKIEVLAEQVTNRGITLVSQEPGRPGPPADALGAQRGLLHAGRVGVRPGRASLGGLHRVVPDRGPAVDFRGPSAGRRRFPPTTTTIWPASSATSRSESSCCWRRSATTNTSSGFLWAKARACASRLESKWFNAEWQWFVGVARGNLGEKECLGLLSPGALDWKLGSARQVDAMFEYGAEGLHLTPLAQAPRRCRPGATGFITKSAAATPPGRTFWKPRRWPCG